MYDIPGQFPYVGRGALIFYIAFYVVQALSLYKLAEKANVRNPWVSFIPVLQAIVFLHIIDKNGWCILLLLIPGVNIVLAIIWAVKFYLAFDLVAGLIVLSIIVPIAGFVITLIMAFSEGYVYVKSNRFAAPQ
jgi:hypothetical protein